MYTIAISNEKGGVAKTTTTVSLGAALAEVGQRVLIVDLDAQANLTLATGVDPHSITRSMADLFLESANLNQVIFNTGTQHLDLAPCNEHMALAERSLQTRSGFEYVLRGALEKSAKKYDFVLLDCPPALTVITLNAFVAANLLLIPTQAEYFSIYALRNLMGWVRQVRMQYNSELTYRMLLTLFDRRNRTHRILREQLNDSFQTGVLQTVIDVDTKLRESPIAGVPILQHAPKSRATFEYRALAQEIIEYVKETAVQPA